MIGRLEELENANEDLKEQLESKEDDNYDSGSF
jgi:hypothetical protein